MYPIYKYGSEEQRKKYLPKLASGEMLGCFGLTEPRPRLQPKRYDDQFPRMGDHYLLNGAKMADFQPHADIAVVWAKNK